MERLQEAIASLLGHDVIVDRNGDVSRPDLLPRLSQDAEGSYRGIHDEDFGMGIHAGIPQWVTVECECAHVTTQQDNYGGSDRHMEYVTHVAWVEGAHPELGEVYADNWHDGAPTTLVVRDYVYENGQLTLVRRERPLSDELQHLAARMLQEREDGKPWGY